MIASQKLLNTCISMEHAIAVGEIYGWRAQHPRMLKRTCVQALMSDFERVKEAYLELIKEVQDGA